MKIYKTTLTYELECITDRKLSKDEFERLKHNIEINISNYGMVRKEGKLIVNTKEIDV